MAPNGYARDPRATANALSLSANHIVDTLPIPFNKNGEATAIKT
jgi:hypothetical protein